MRQLVPGLASEPDGSATYTGVNPLLCARGGRGSIMRRFRKCHDYAKPDFSLDPLGVGFASIRFHNPGK